jgi:hypothetical protein
MTASREYKLAADPAITPVSGQVRREILEITDDRRKVILVVANDDALDVRDALERAYQDGRESRAEEVGELHDRLAAAESRLARETGQVMW